MSAPTVQRTPFAKRAWGALAGVDTPTFEIMMPRLSWKRRLLRWCLRKAARMVRRTFRRGWIWRRALAPWYVAMVTWLAAALASQVQRGSVTLAALGLIGAVPLWWWLGMPAWRFTRRRDLKPAVQRYWYAAFYAALWGWSTIAAAWTALPPMAGILWAFTFTVWVAWMWHHRTRPVAVAAGQVMAFDDRLARWGKVAGQGKPLAGAELVGIEEHEGPARWESDIDLPSGDLTVENVFRAHRRIASAFSARRDNVILDEAPGGAEDRAHLTVVLENPCHGVIEYDETWQEDFADGCFAFHTYPDGFRGGLRLWQPMSGTAHSLFTGDTRAGKTGGMEAAAIQAIATGLVWPMVGDPQGGQSMPALCGPEGIARSKATDPEQVINQLLALREAMYARSNLLKKMRWRDEDGDHVGLGYFDPHVTGLPILLYLLDEAHIAFRDPEYGPQIIALVDEIVKMAGKTGIAVWLATQYPGIEDLGNKMSIRQNVIAGNVIAYKNSAAVSKGMVLPSHMPSPYEIPKETPDGGHTKGTAVIYSSAPRSSRATYSRSVWVRRAHHWAGVVADRIPDLADVDPRTAEALAAYLPASTSGEPAATPERESIEVAPTRRRRESNIDRIVSFLRERPDQRAHTGVIADALGISKSAASTALGRGDGKVVHQVRRGIWGLGAQPRHEQLAIDGEAAA